MPYGNLNQVTPNAGGGRVFADIAYNANRAAVLKSAQAMELLGFTTNSKFHETINSEGMNYLGQGGSTENVDTTRTPDPVTGTLGAAIDDDVQATIEMLETWHEMKTTVGVNRKRWVYQILPRNKADGTIEYKATCMRASCSTFKEADNDQATVASYNVEFTTSGMKYNGVATYNASTDTFNVTWDETVVEVTGITVTGAGAATTIAVDGGTLQMSAAILPADATNKNVVWGVTNGTGQATISAGGLLTAVADGTVTVIATAIDGSGVTDTLEITISNQ